MSDLECADKSPLKAAGDPIVIGFQNPEGDPNGSFPEATLGAQAAVKYINEELGGWGSDIQNGKPGRPIQLEVCKTAISPDDSQRCANEIVSKKPDLAVSTINFFGNHLPIYEAAGIPAIVTSPVTIADFTSKSAYAIAGGGGCLGAHTALVEYAAVDLKAKRVAVPWADTPPGVVCYYDLEAKPLDVLKGAVKSTSKQAGIDPRPRAHRRADQAGDAGHHPAGHPDPRLQARRDHLLGAGRRLLEPGRRARPPRLDAGQDPARHVRIVHRLRRDEGRRRPGQGRLLHHVRRHGDATTRARSPTRSPSSRRRSSRTKPSEYGMDKSDLFKGFGANGFNSMVNIWELSVRAASGGAPPTGQEFAAHVKATADDHMFGSTPLSCSTAPPPYVAVCNSVSPWRKWDGTGLVPVKAPFSAADLVAGTELKPGP